MELYHLTAAPPHARTCPARRISGHPRQGHATGTAGNRCMQPAAGRRAGCLTKLYPPAAHEHRALAIVSLMALCARLLLLMILGCPHAYSLPGDDLLVLGVVKQRHTQHQHHQPHAVDSRQVLAQEQNRCQDCTTKLAVTMLCAIPRSGGRTPKSRGLAPHVK